MTFAEKLKDARKHACMSQEKLAENLGVSRQAVTKWEIGAGMPDIENIIVISSLFGISLDDLLTDEKIKKQQTDFLFESVTEYDIDRSKRYDMNFGGAKAIVLSGYDGEKIRVRLASNTISTLQSDFKLIIDDVKKRIDLDISRKNCMTEAMAKEALNIFILIPKKYIGKIELAACAETLELNTLECDSVELDIKTYNLILNNVIGTVEVNCNLDMNIICSDLRGSVEINQVSATSKITLPVNMPFSAVVRGIGTSISYNRNGQTCEDLSTIDADNIIELNGLKSELIICV